MYVQSRNNRYRYRESSLGVFDILGPHDRIVASVPTINTRLPNFLVETRVPFVSRIRPTRKRRP